MRPIFKDLVFAFIAANIYLVLIHLYNLWMSTNYSYTMHKPLNPSIIDYFGPWPWYLLTGQLLALILFFVMYLPFWISRKKHIK